jgi:hypothetical protein
MDKFYWSEFGIFLAELLLTPFVLICMLICGAAYCGCALYVWHRRNMLRLMKFKFRGGVDNDMMFETMRPILRNKYAMQIEKSDGVMTVVHEEFMYDVLIEQDETFRISWRQVIPRPSALRNKYRAYKLNVADMVIVAHEIQTAFGVAM